MMMTMMHSPPCHSDSWMQECGEAMHLADDISALINDRASLALEHPSRHTLAIRRNLTMLVTKLDRLESLLRNPPVNANLSDKELGRREDLLLKIRARTKGMADSLRVPQVSKRADLQAQGEKPSTKALQSSVSAGYDSGRPLNPREHATLEQAEDPAMPSATGACTRTDSSLLVDEEMNLQNPLLVSSEETSDSTIVQISHICTYLGRRAEEKCSPMYICLTFICFVVFIVILLSMLKLT